MEEYANDFNNPDLVLLGMEMWRATQVEALKFVEDTGISHPLLLNAHTYADSLGYGWEDRNHFAVINKVGELVFKTGVDVDYFDGWQPKDLTPVIEEALAQ